MKNIYYILIILSLVVLSVNTSLSQNANKQKLQYAQTFEQSGDFKTAARIYKELFDSNPKNDEYFNGVVRNFKAQSKYSELLPVVESYIKNFKTVYTFTIYAELLWRTGSHEKANEYWKKALELLPEDENTYSIIAMSQVELSQYGKAVNTLETGREELNKSTLFADDLCRLFIATGNYKRGTEEALNILAVTRNIALAQGRISALMNSPEAEKYILSVLEDAASRQNRNYLYLKVYGWFLRSTGKLDKAFEVYKEMDVVLNAQGREVLNFANDSKKDGQFDMALKAFEYVISLGKKSRFLSSALYGYSRTLEQKLLSNTTLSIESAERIIEHYRDIIEQFPKQSTAIDARYRISLIAADYLNDNEMAKNEINLLIKEYPRLRITASALNLLGRIYLSEDNFEKAKVNFQRVIKSHRKNAPAEVMKAKFDLAEIEFFQGNIDTAKSLYGELSIVTNSDIANNALERIVLLEQNKELTRGLSIYAKALYRLKQKKYDSSLTYLNTLFEKYPKSIYKDRTLLAIGNCHIRLNLKDKAIKSFSELITDFPRSIYLQEARDKIRLLRDNKNL